MRGRLVPRATIARVPQGFILRTLMVGGRGVTDTVEAWGGLLLREYGKPSAREVLQAG